MIFFPFLAIPLLGKEMGILKPGYVTLFERGVLGERVRQAKEILEDCRLCPRACGVNRLEGEFGFCRTGPEAVVASFHPHFGEEAPLVGEGGSGTIFIAYCNLGCLFCQNYEISHLGEGEPASGGRLARMMLSLQAMGCHNINIVTPTHVVPQILEALEIAVPEGLSLPLVYNSGGYDRVSTLKLLEGVVDIYMPDFKFWESGISGELGEAPDYPEVAREAIREMHRQVGDLILDEKELAVRGLLVRHLVLPEGLAGTQPILRFLAREISPNTYVNVMDQYRPCGKAFAHPRLSRTLTSREYLDALALAWKAGLKRLDQRTGIRILRRL
jgi:putative pyruvate formate lyase activating enzyme